MKPWTIFIFSSRYHSPISQQDLAGVCRCSRKSSAWEEELTKEALGLIKVKALSLAPSVKPQFYLNFFLSFHKPNLVYSGCINIRISEEAIEKFLNIHHKHP